MQHGSENSKKNTSKPIYCMKDLGKSVAKAITWDSALAAIREGRVKLTTRQPTDDPVWVTHEVLHGGIPTEKRLAALAEGDRPNDHFITQEGARELLELVESGRYEVSLPEHAALPYIVLLLRDGKYEEAQKIVDVIVPWFDRLRFYPTPCKEQVQPSVLVHLESVENVKQGLKATVRECKANLGGHETPSTRRDAENIAVTRVIERWIPMRKKLLLLFSETVRAGKLMQVFPEKFRANCTEAVNGYDALIAEEDSEVAEWRKKGVYVSVSLNSRRRHKGTVAALIRQVRRMAQGEQMQPGDLRHIQMVYKGACAKHIQRKKLKMKTIKEELVHKLAASGLRIQMLEAMVARLDAMPSGGLTSEQIKTVLEPDELHGPWPEGMARKVRKTQIGTMDTLVRDGVVRSSEMLTELVSQVSAAVMAPTDPATGMLYYALKQAWATRRSLLLMHLEAQVKLRELPWVINARPDASETARATLCLVVCTALRGFPQTIIPNKLRQSVVELVEQADLHAAMVDELAADIFMGKFSPKFADAARAAKHMLVSLDTPGKLNNIYATYFDLRPLWLEGAAESAEGLAAACKQRADERGCQWRGNCRNGCIIEWEQIITTHSLAGLYSELELSTKMVGSELAVTAWEWILKQLGSLPVSVAGRLPVAKNIAYAWRQLVFFLSTDRQGASAAIQWMYDLAVVAVTTKDKSQVAQTASETKLENIEAVFIRPLTAVLQRNTPAANPVVGWVADYRHSFIAKF